MVIQACISPRRVCKRNYAPENRALCLCVNSLMRKKASKLSYAVRCPDLEVLDKGMSAMKGQWATCTKEMNINVKTNAQEKEQKIHTSSHIRMENSVTAVDVQNLPCKQCSRL